MCLYFGGSNSTLIKTFKKILSLILYSAPEKCNRKCHIYTDYIPYFNITLVLINTKLDGFGCCGQISSCKCFVIHIEFYD